MAARKDSPATRLLAFVLFLLAFSGGAGFAVAYWLKANTQFLGGLLALALIAAAGALVVWSRAYVPRETASGPREPIASPNEELEVLSSDISRGAKAVSRRRFLLAGLLAFGAALGAAFISLLRSLMGPNPQRTLTRTSWTRGMRLVRRDGTPIEADKVAEGSIIVVFPEGHIDEISGSAALFRVKPEKLKLRPERMAWTVNGLVAYSRVCTHAGCPVSQYYDTESIVACPCHQSTFDLLEGGRPTGGPASRPLPQLPLGVDAAGHLVALGDFSSPVGPGFWSWSS
jgi:ubiquinol-cytochrome c reductase iron-sulfur subunit